MAVRVLCAFALKFFHQSASHTVFLNWKYGDSLTAFKVLVFTYLYVCMYTHGFIVIVIVM